MSGFGVKYAVVIGAIMLLFVNFVACGSQLYKVPLKEDIPQEGVPAEASDPNSERYGIHALNGWKDIPIHFKVGVRINDADERAGVIRGLVRAMNTWQLAVGKDLFRFEGVHEGVNGDSFRELYDSLPDKIQGHYMDQNWRKTNKPLIVLATTIWENKASNWETIDTADIRFNSEFYNIGNSLMLEPDEGREVVDMETLALHELGHLLGLTHVDVEIDSDSIMNPELYIGAGLYYRRLSRGDVERIQKIYSCSGRSCDLDWVLDQLDRRALDVEEDGDLIVSDESDESETPDDEGFDDESSESSQTH